MLLSDVLDFADWTSYYTCIHVYIAQTLKFAEIGFAVGHLGQSAFAFVFAVAHVADGISREDKYQKPN